MNRADAGLSRTLLFVALLAAILNFIAFYPGILHHDAWAYFWQARDHKLDNWQPPLLGYVWMPLQKIHYGPQPMLALFVACTAHERLRQKAARASAQTLEAS